MTFITVETTVRRVRALVALPAAALALFALIAATASAQYPAPTPDFSHPGSPHSALLSPASGTDGRPLLVIHAVYSDFQEPVTTAQVRDRFFAGSFGSVGDYYRSQSFGRFELTPAPEREGIVNDGVIRAPMGRVADIQTAGNDLGGPFGRQAVLAANATNDWIDFKAFDANGDSVVDERELAIVVLTDYGDGSACGGTRTITPTTVDGITLSGRTYSFDFGLENIITHAHELAHQTLGTEDQSYIAGPYDITSLTCGGQPYFSINSWHKLHFGWTQPRVVTRDGYYDVPDWTSSGTSFLLYDHGRGTEDYFLVENRQRAGYDRSIADTGLIVWEVNERAFGTRAFSLVRPDGAAIPNSYGGQDTDAFDASDPRTVRTMTRPWQDGTASRVAVRAVGESATTMRAYFDVRGPGVLVDAYKRVPDRLAPGESSDVEVTVMNTGEASDSFAFSLSSLPAGWTAAAPPAMTLAAGEARQVVVAITPAAGAPADRTYTIEVTATSTTDGSVSTTAPLRVGVLPTISVDDVTVTEGDAGTQDATFTLSLSGPSDDIVKLGLPTHDGTATAPEDYVASNKGFIFQAGETSKQLTVAVKGDTTPEPDEHFFVRMTNVLGAKVADGEGRGTILTDPEPSLSIGDVRIEEENATATFTVVLSEANNTPVSVQYATSDATAMAAADYSATSGRLDYPIGETRRTIAVPIREDLADELDEETFVVTLSQAVNATIADGQATGTIRDDDRNGVFSCRATGVRLGDGERGVANAPRIPCRDDSAGGFQIGSGLLSVSAASGSATTNQTPDDLTGTAPRVGDSATAHSEATTIVIRAGANLVRVSGFVSDAKAECTGSGAPRLTGGSRVTALAVAGTPVLTTSARTTIPLLFATLRLNETVVGPTGITQRALVVDNAVGADIVLGESHAGFGGTSVHPGGHPCVA